MSINFTELPTMGEALDCVASLGHKITLYMQAEPGIGKSSMMIEFAKRMGDAWRRPGDERLAKCAGDKYNYIYVDCPNMDVPDVGMAIPNHDTKSLALYHNDLFMMRDPRPKVIMLDELAKTPKILQPIFTRLTLNRTLGNDPLPELNGVKSVVFATSNNSSDKVGDALASHTINRICITQVKKPNASQWNLWAGENGISRVTRAWVAMNPRCLASYLDGGQEANPYIFSPTKPVQPFVSPRSLELADNVIKERDALSQTMLIAGLCGLLGTAAGQELHTFLDLERQVLTTAEVIADPKGVDMPKDIAATFMMMFNAIDELVTQDELSAFMTFVERIKSNEVQSIFFDMLTKTRRTIQLARGNIKVQEWVKKNHGII